MRMNVWIWIYVNIYAMCIFRYACSKNMQLQNFDLLLCMKYKSVHAIRCCVFLSRRCSLNFSIPRAQHNQCSNEQRTHTHIRLVYNVVLFSCSIGISMLWYFISYHPHLLLFYQLKMCIIQYFAIVGVSIISLRFGLGTAIFIYGICFNFFWTIRPCWSYFSAHDNRVEKVVNKYDDEVQHVRNCCSPWFKIHFLF